MKIAQVAPLYESVPPQLYGGTERVVSYLTEELVRQGHDVTLYASGDSTTRARLKSPCKRSLRLWEECQDQLAYHTLLLEQVIQDSGQFDIVHFHVDYLHFPLSRRIPQAHVTTLHGRLDIPDLQPLYREFGEQPLVSISDAQRKPLPRANWEGTVYHGLPENMYALHTHPGDYLVFLGRIAREKRPDRAIEIACRAGLPLKIAAKVSAVDLDYHRSTVAPLIREAGRLVEFVGEVGERDKSDLLGNARALLFPIDWPEPFGLVMIESLALGTPVIGFPCGSVPEVVEDGVTGFVVSSVDEAVAAVGQLESIDRATCRAEFEKRFSSSRMAKDYLAIYRRLAAQADGAPVQWSRADGPRHLFGSRSPATPLAAPVARRRHPR